jgi:hypothetical protein
MFLAAEKGDDPMRIAGWLTAAMSVMVAVHVFAPTPAAAFHQDPPLVPEPLFVVCQDQRYALCAAASCFVYNGVAYCQCDVLKGDSISLQLDFSTATGEENVCDVNAQGKTNGFMVSTFSLPADVVKGGPSAVYTCPGKNNAGSGGPAPVAYGQCDGGICFTSTTSKTFPGFDDKFHKDIVCSCPISTDATKGSTNALGLGYQVFGPYNPKAPAGQRCDASACATCSVPNPTANGTIIPVGAPTGVGKFLTDQLTGSVPSINECLCQCPANGPCTVREDTTP